MIVEGTHRIQGALAEAVFDAMADPKILARTLPGCRNLVDRGDGVYEVAIDVGIGSIHGSYSGRVHIRESRRPQLYEATLDAGGAQGTVTASMRAQLTSTPVGTDIAYLMDARLAGRIAGIGQRVVAGVARRNAVRFFNALERELSGGPAPVEPPRPLAAAGAADAVEGARSHRRAIAVRSFCGAAALIALACLARRVRSGRR